MNHAAPPTTAMGAIVPILVVLVVVALRARSLTRERPLKPEQLWVVPAIYLLIAGLLFYAQPPTLIGWACAAAGLVLGAALGWQRGRLMHIAVDPETGTLRQKGSLAAMLFLVGLIAVRTALREAALFHVGGIDIDVNLVTQLLVALALGLLTLQRVEMYLRAKRLLAG